MIVSDGGDVVSAISLGKSDGFFDVFARENNLMLYLPIIVFAEPDELFVGKLPFVIVSQSDIDLNGGGCEFQRFVL